MKIKLPVTYSVCGFVEVEADSIESAVDYFEENVDHIPLPLDVETEYVEGSYELSSKDIDYIAFYNTPEEE